MNFQRNLEQTSPRVLIQIISCQISPFIKPLEIYLLFFLYLPFFILIGSSTPIKSEDLRSTDIDSEDTHLIYTLTQDPPHGRLVLVVAGKEVILSKSEPSKTFTQKQINDGKGSVDSKHPVCCCLPLYYSRQSFCKQAVWAQFRLHDLQDDLSLNICIYMCVKNLKIKFSNRLSPCWKYILKPCFLKYMYRRYLP